MDRFDGEAGGGCIISGGSGRNCFGGYAASQGYLSCRLLVSLPRFANLRLSLYTQNNPAVWRSP